MDAMAIKKQTRLELSCGPYEFTKVGLAIVGSSTKDQWTECGEGLRLVDEARQWAIGDWLNDGKSHYGDRLYEQATKITQDKSQALENHAWLARLFEISTRVENLSWTHHREVAGIKNIAKAADGKLYLSDDPNKDKMQAFLKEAEKKNWTVVELRAAVREYKEWQRAHIAAANEPDKYAVMYADPPWQYNSGDQHATEEQETTLGDHYPSMPLVDICNLPQANLAATDCVLFLWATSPTLEEALEVINAWGFSYKASMVWDKEDHNVGHYVSVRHELLLIATKGQPPKVPKLVDSVYVEKRGEHSVKPEYFRNLIDELYPEGKRLELFARKNSEGWETWGNEV